MRHFKLISHAAALAALSYGSAALALPVDVGTSYVFTLTTSQSGSGLPDTSYATVTLEQSAADKVDVNVILKDGFEFADTGVGPQFAFNLDHAFAGAAVSLSAATAQYFQASASGAYNVTPYGTFTNAVSFRSGVGNGLSAGVDVPIDFSVSQAGISLNDFTTSTPRSSGPSGKQKASSGQAGGYAFAIDLGYASTGKTGGVGQHGLLHDTQTPPSTPVPEPASLALFGLGMGGLAVLRRKRHSASG